VDALLEILFAVLTGGTGPIKKKKKAVRPFFIAFLLVYVCFIVWMTVDFT
jgi:hypothetical protein